MEILVNQEPLSYTLENEERLGEIVDGLADWLRSGNYEITAINVDEQSVPIHDRAAWEHTEVGSVSTLSVEALPFSQVEQTTLAAIADYCALFRRALDEANHSAVTELTNELPYVRARLASILPELFPPSGSPDVLANPSLDAGEIPQGAELAQVQQQLDQIIVLLESRLREYATPERELALTLGQLVASVPALGEVPVQLQTGDEAGAMNTVIVLTEQLSRVIRLLPLVRDPGFDVDAIRAFATDLTPHLLELQRAFEVHDSVLIGDLLEYEIAPRIGELPALFPDTVSAEADADSAENHSGDSQGGTAEEPPR